MSNRPANRNGVVFIAEYHNIGNRKDNMFRTASQFESDLNRLYRLGFRPVTASEYLSGKILLPPGASPVVITFDDAQPTQFQFLSDDSIDPNCAIGIWQKFAKVHPDFPVKATFFVLPDMWGQPKLRKKKVEMLNAWGCEIANHTVTHPKLSKLTDEQVKAELAGGAGLVKSYGLQGDPLFALPFGISPKNKELLKSFTLHGQTYRQRAVFLVGANPAPMPGTKAFNLYRIPRIIAQEGPYGLSYWLDLLEKGKVKPYVAP